jgi:hypothetical protein
LAIGRLDDLAVERFTDLSIPFSIGNLDFHIGLPYHIGQLNRHIGKSPKRPIDQSPYRQIKKASTPVEAFLLLPYLFKVAAR